MRRLIRRLLGVEEATMRIEWHYSLCEPAIVLAAAVQYDAKDNIRFVENGLWYSYVVLPQRRR